MKYCLECRYWRYGESRILCAHPSAPPSPDPVMGNDALVICAVARDDDGFCGPEGRYWEPSLWTRVKRLFNEEANVATIRPARIEVFQHANKEWGFRLIAGNGETVADGEGYTKRQDAIRGARDFKRLVAGAEIVDKEAESDVL
jgi:uncharacterized protein